jgi:hypothetical protein
VKELNVQRTQNGTFSWYEHIGRLIQTQMSKTISSLNTNCKNSRRPKYMQRPLTDGKRTLTKKRLKIPILISKTTLPGTLKLPFSSVPSHPSLTFLPPLPLILVI